jgi:hypothetical protein
MKIDFNEIRRRLENHAECLLIEIHSITTPKGIPIKVSTLDAIKEIKLLIDNAEKAYNSDVVLISVPEGAKHNED